MKRLYLTVEGQTEEEFAMTVLRPHLANFNVFLLPPRFTGPHGRRGGRIPRGGLLHTFQHTLADIQRWLKGDKSADARFSMMVDLYHLPHDFPGYKEGMSKSNGWAQAASLEQSLAAAIGDGRFIPYLQVHEFEALVLSDPSRIATLYDVKAAEIEALCDECQRFESPEQIDHGQRSHPKPSAAYMPSRFTSFLARRRRRRSGTRHCKTALA
ncbi:MAG TPA: DUF4276 family protein [Pirellulales bacterium]|nr:DUF4276 family protein [Pirellulales bacterium]